MADLINVGCLLFLSWLSFVAGYWRDRVVVLRYLGERRDQSTEDTRLDLLCRKDDWFREPFRRIEGGAS